jgi:KUP system potassium uptake protein
LGSSHGDKGRPGARRRDAGDGSAHTGPPQSKRELIALSATALGIVFGDIGTSPLYGMRAAFSGESPVAATSANVLGVLSLIFWALILIVSIKYIGLVMRADNRGEGGMLALAALTAAKIERKTRLHSAVLMVGVCGASLLYADGVITPAISVVSALEGVEVATPALQPIIIPVTVIILIALFAIQSRGTSAVGQLFAPITFLWFTVLAVLGVSSILREPGVLAAVNPLHGILFLMRNGAVGFTALGAVFLVVTGGEALYADMGHFGRRPIRVAWFALVLPSLVINYFGQGAEILTDPTAIEHPFYGLAPHWALWPLVVLATLATVIASQAVISGAFSLTKQAIQLGYLPRLRIDHTSSRYIGQVYVGTVNRFMMLVCIGLVVGFGSSEALAAAYGFAVSTTMVLTILLVGLLARVHWKWRWRWVIALPGVLLLIDLVFLSANVVKIPHGGWFPVLMATAIVAVMEVWRLGTRRVAQLLEERKLSDKDFLAMIEHSPPARVSGTAVFMDRQATGIPPSLLHNLKHNQVLHKRVWLVTVVTRDVPRVPESERVDFAALGQGVGRLVLEYGFFEEPDVPAAIALCRNCGEKFDPMRTTFFFGRETLIPTKGPGMSRMAKSLYVALSRNAAPARAFFRIPPNRVVELGAQIDF